MTEKVILTLRSAPSVSIEVTDERCQRSCYGALRFYPGIPKTITKEELAYIEKTDKGVVSRFDVRAYVESKRIDKRGITERQVEELALKKGVDHLPFARKVEVFAKQSQVDPPAVHRPKPVEPPVSAASKKSGSKKNDSKP